MERAAGYSESSELTFLIEQLRERLGRTPSPEQLLARDLEEVLARLVIRNQRLRVLHRLARIGSSDEHIGAMRSTLEQLDAQLLKELPSILERLHPSH
jgi:3-methyladenine DNA glycosylase/8-oxoguanine DNA glycosylase